MMVNPKITTYIRPCSKVVDNIQSVGGMDQLRAEIERYCVDDDIKENVAKDQGFEQYWKDVGELTEGGAGWQRYTVLSRWGLSMGVKLNDTSEVERTFSVMNNIHQDKQRNMMSQDMLNSHLHTRSGVESKKNREKCERCKDPEVRPHCHCMVTDITPTMRQKCKQAWIKCKTAQEEGRKVREEETKELAEKRKKTEEEEDERIATLKEDLKLRVTFCQPRLLNPVYPSKKSLDKKTDQETEKSKNNSGNENNREKKKDDDTGKSNDKTQEKRKKPEGKSSKDKEIWSKFKRGRNDESTERYQKKPK